MIERILSPVEQETFSQRVIIKNSDDVRRGTEARLTPIEHPIDITIVFERRMRFETILIRIIFSKERTVECTSKLTQH